MARTVTSSHLKLAVADNSDRQSIYRLRHEVYARELGQHPPNDLERLTDELDLFNIYLVAKQEDRVVGFISVTPPGGRFSIDKYLNRAQLPFQLDGSVYEIRILTVCQDHRHDGRGIALVLMLAALRWIESQGGRRIVAIGRLEVIRLYNQIGMKLLGLRMSRGRVTFELMTATTDELSRCVQKRERTFRRAVASVDWKLSPPPFRPAPCFHGGAFFDAIGDRFTNLSRRHEVINADVLDAWFPPSPKVLSELRQHLPWLIQTSPPAACSGLIDVIASARGVPRGSLLPGAGSSDLILRVLRHWLTPASRVLMLDPTYGEYAHVLEQVIGCRVERFRLHREADYRINASKLESRARDGFDLIVLVNPNSPTGTYLDRKAMVQLLSRLPRRTRIWVDETYIDYLGPGQTIEDYAAASPNVFVCKSMSKVYALSGMRAAYLCGNAASIAQLRAITPPWVIGLPAQVAAVAALGDPEYYRQCYAQTHHLREELSQQLHSQLAWKVYPGIANFVLVDLPADGIDAATLENRCRAHGLFLRNVRTMGHRMENHTLRIAVKNETENARMLEILVAASESQPHESDAIVI